MSSVSKIREFYLSIKKLFVGEVISPVMRKADKLNYPGQEDISLLDIGKFFIVGLQKGDIQARARSASFDFFLAIFPTIIFFFTMIPYIPVVGLQERILLLLQDVLPPAAATRRTAFFRVFVRIICINKRHQFIDRRI